MTDDQHGEDGMEGAVKAYVARYNAADIDGIVALFAPDAVVEDPVGTDLKVGHDALRAFFAIGVGAGAKLALDGPVRVAGGYAAFPLQVTLEWDGQMTRIDAIDTFRFNADGTIAEMRVYFGPNNIAAAQGD